MDNGMETLTLHASGMTFPALSSGSGPVVLCLHGFPDHKKTFLPTLPALAAANYRAIAPTMRGYAPECQPANGDYSLARIVDDVIGWIDDLGGAPVHLVGHDWGAVVGYLVAAREPQRLRSLVTMAVPHPRRIVGRPLLEVPRQLRNSWYIAFFQLRGIADRAVAFNDFALIERLWRDWSPGWEPPPSQLQILRDTLRQPGVMKAALGYYRAFTDVRSQSARETRSLMARPVPVPTLALAGASDGCMDPHMWDYAINLRDFPSGVRVERVLGAGHFMHQERPVEVNRLILDWLKKHP